MHKNPLHDPNNTHHIPNANSAKGLPADERKATIFQVAQKALALYAEGVIDLEPISETAIDDTTDEITFRRTYIGHPAQA